MVYEGVSEHEFERQGKKKKKKTKGGGNRQKEIP